MDAGKQAAFASMMKRYTKAKRSSKEIAFKTLVDEGIYTTDGKIAVEYGGPKNHKKVASAKR